MFKRVSAIALSLSLAACATVIDPIQRNAPLKLAFTEPVPSLETRAAAGDKPAQYALSFLARFGARGVPQDTLRSDGLRAQAGFPTSRNQPIYVPGANGQPGSMISVAMSTPGIGDAEARRMDLCGLSLLASRPALGGQACGSPAAFIDLLPAARGVTAEILALGPPTAPVPPVDPATVTTCEATPPLWSAAIDRFQSADYAGATTPLDRIIALCGETQPSWHPRVMRALIATEAGEPAEALTLLAPVPRPAPAPIGGYVGFVAMQAQAAAGNWTGYRDERDRLIAAALAAVAAEPGVTPAGQPFTVADTRVHLFERRRPMGAGLDAVMTAIVVPAGDRDAPRAYYLTTSPDFERPASRQYFLDEYRCDGRSTLEYFGVLTAAPTAATVRGLIERRLAGALEPASGSSFDRGLSACQFPSQVAPGLGDG